MRARLTVFLILGVSAVFGLLVARQFILSRNIDHEAFAEKKLRLLTYATFVSQQGPGPTLIGEFEKQCGCKVEVTAVRDAGLLLERMKMGRFDVVIGLDQLMLDDARKESAWQSLEIENVEWAEPAGAFADSEFVPFDWSPMAFVYQSDGKPLPDHFDDLLKPEFKNQFALQDPRASSPGLQFVNWVLALKSDKAVDFFQAFEANVHSVSPSWSFAYGLFKKGQARFVFSYLTSLAYHWATENDRSYKVVSFPEGHPVQVEFAAVPQNCRQCELGAEFVQHMVQPASQRAIMEKNFMLPALKGVEKGTIFAELPELKVLHSGKAKDLSAWDKVFGQ
jgi:thiamine transport system substrate-binding protein